MIYRIWSLCLASMTTWTAGGRIWIRGLGTSRGLLGGRSRWSRRQALQFSACSKFQLEYMDPDADINNCMHHIFVILLNLPYVTKGHLYSAQAAPHCLYKCAKAAIRLAYIVQAYCAAFTVR